MESPSPGLWDYCAYFVWLNIVFGSPIHAYSKLIVYLVNLFAELDQSLQGLLSFERLDRASPDLWPEQSELKFKNKIHCY